MQAINELHVYTLYLKDSLGNSTLVCNYLIIMVLAFYGLKFHGGCSVSFLEAHYVWVCIARVNLSSWHAFYSQTYTQTHTHVCAAHEHNP